MPRFWITCSDKSRQSVMHVCLLQRMFSFPPHSNDCCCILLHHWDKVSFACHFYIHNGFVFSFEPVKKWGRNTVLHHFFLERWPAWPSALKNNHLTLWIEHWPDTHMKSSYFKVVLSSCPILGEFQFVFLSHCLFSNFSRALKADRFWKNVFKNLLLNFHELLLNQPDDF